MPNEDAAAQAFRDRANRAAAEIVAANHDGTVFSYDSLIRMVALGWLRGAQEGREDVLERMGGAE